MRGGRGNGVGKRGQNEGDRQREMVTEHTVCLLCQRETLARHDYSPNISTLRVSRTGSEQTYLPPLFIILARLPMHTHFHAAYAAASQHDLLYIYSSLGLKSTWSVAIRFRPRSKFYWGGAVYVPTFTIEFTMGKKAIRGGDRTLRRLVARSCNSPLVEAIISLIQKWLFNFARSAKAFITLDESIYLICHCHLHTR